MKLILETDRLRLREMVSDDLDFVATMLGDGEVMRYYTKQYTRQDAQEWLERQLWRYAEHGHGLWLVLDRATGEPIGQVGLVLQEVAGAKEPEIGWLIHRPFWRRGFASEAALGVRRHAFGTRGLERVISLIRPENEPSRGVARKLGMTVERETFYKNIPHLVYSVKREVTSAQRPGNEEPPPMDEPPRETPPPDPGKVTLQVIVDVVCLILSVALAFAAAVWLFQLRLPGDVASEILFTVLALGAAISLVLLGVALRAWVRGLFGVTDTARGEEPNDSLKPVPPDAEEDDLSEPTSCLMCGSEIPAGAAQCPRCGWTYRPG